ncbi:MAG: hypothetical protein F4222_11895 [Gammaproteobacteria bacterium]|nr:hypothetical protein [Gammaproteobacteria bacterium]MYF59751.1 hypothetical protein [Gammaproteobacteria bacterium]
MSEARFHRLRVVEVRPETDSAVCVTFDVPEPLRDTFRFIQGQYLTLSARINGENVSRSYSICSGVDDGCLKVGIKKIDGGLFSTYANECLSAGDEIRVMPPKGNFHTALSADNRKNYMCICIGSGITPILSIVKSILEREPRSVVTLLYGNRNSATVMFKSELSFLKNRYMTRFNWVNILSREEQDAEVLYGRIDNRKGGELQRKRLIDIAGTDEFFLCGPQSMISEVSRGLRGSGVDETHIHYELFSSSIEGHYIPGLTAHVSASGAIRGFADSPTAMASAVNLLNSRQHSRLGAAAMSARSSKRSAKQRSNSSRSPDSYAFAMPT